MGESHAQPSSVIMLIQFAHEQSKAPMLFRCQELKTYSCVFC